MLCALPLIRTGWLKILLLIILSRRNEGLQDVLEVFAHSFGTLLGEEGGPFNCHEATSSSVGHCLHPGHVIAVETCSSGLSKRRTAHGAQDESTKVRTKSMVEHTRSHASLHQCTTANGEIKNSLDLVLRQHGRVKGNWL